MSNLIKSEKVIEVGVPVNVGMSSLRNKNYSGSRIVRTPNDIPNQGKNESVSPASKSEPEISKEEILKKYMDEAKKKADEYYKSEVERAYNDGITKAEEEASKIIEEANIQRENILDEVVKIKEDAIKEYKDEIKNSEKDIIDLALSIVEKIINYEVDRSDEYVLGIVKDALDRVLNKKDVILKLSTADYYTVVSNKKYLMTNVKGFGEIEIVQEESMEPGSCIVDTPLGTIDGGIQVRMDNIHKEVMKIISET